MKREARWGVRGGKCELASWSLQRAGLPHGAADGGWAAGWAGGRGEHLRHGSIQPRAGEPRLTALWEREPSQILLRPVRAEFLEAVGTCGDAPLPRPSWRGAGEPGSRGWNLVPGTGLFKEALCSGGGGPQKLWSERRAGARRWAGGPETARPWLHRRRGIRAARVVPATDARGNRLRIPQALPRPAECLAGVF